jgi:hypothetical protein
MAHTVTLTDITPELKDQVISDFKSEGAQVIATEQADGNWTIVALFPDGPNSHAAVAAATAATKKTVKAKP